MATTKNVVCCLVILATAHIISGQLCTNTNKEHVGRVVFGEASGEPSDGQLEVAYTVVNRLNHVAYPNTLNGVILETYRSDGRTRYHYETMGKPNHDRRWKAAKKTGSGEHSAYNDAKMAAGHALCGTKSDPMSCGPVNFCAWDPCPSTNDNKYWCVSQKRKIGSHWFACIVKKTGQC
ncbi:uncharacterized protein LOC143049089 [Mytilus galloprovincialis]|uniref:uncharacterized protein LOC143049089 n=1 Tax=Mytilus galloprovincialis TaxID=29158 RepID=UPI003F7C2186